MDEDKRKRLVVSSWFRVTDEERYEILMASLTSDHFIMREDRQSEEGDTLHRFSCRGRLEYVDRDPGMSSMQTFYRKLGELLPYEDDTVTIKELVVDEETLDVEAYATVLSQRFCDDVSLNKKADELASRLIDPDAIF